MRQSFIARKWTTVTAVCLAVAAVSPSRLSACGLDWSPPANHFDGVDERGCVEYWEKVADVDFGEGLRLPMEIGFRSRYETGIPSPHLGAGWVLPLLESNFVQTGENSFEMLQPDGWTNLFLRRDATTLNGSAGWMAEINGDTITAWARCGWKIEFYKGHIVSMTTPENREFDFAYTGNVVTAIRENGATRLGVEQDTDGKVTALVFNDRRMQIVKDQKPRVQNIAGQNLVAGIDESLRSITPSDGPSKSFEFAVNDKIQPTLKISSESVQQRLFTWDPTTKRILKDNDWAYQVTPPIGPMANAAISRRNAQKQSEYWFYDAANGREIAQGINEAKEIKSWFVSGKLNGATRKIETVSPDGKTEITRQVFYDEQGKILRVFDHGATIYYTDGKITKVIKGDLTLWEIHYDSNGFVHDVTHVNQTE